MTKGPVLSPVCACDIGRAATGARWLLAKKKHQMRVFSIVGGADWESTAAAVSAAGHPLHPHPCAPEKQARKEGSTTGSWGLGRQIVTSWGAEEQGRSRGGGVDWEAFTEQFRHEEHWGELSCDLCLLLGQCFTGKQGNGLSAYSFSVGKGLEQGWITVLIHVLDIKDIYCYGPFKTCSLSYASVTVKYYVLSMRQHWETFLTAPGRMWLSPSAPRVSTAWGTTCFPTALPPFCFGRNWNSLKCFNVFERVCTRLQENSVLFGLHRSWHRTSKRELRGVQGVLR